MYFLIKFGLRPNAGLTKASAIGLDAIGSSFNLGDHFWHLIPTKSIITV